MTKISVGGKYLINNCREVKNRYFVFISASQQELRHNVEAVAEDALGLSAVFEDANGVVLQSHKLAYVIAPHECNHHQQEQFFNPVQISKMCILNIEPALFIALNIVSICQRFLYVSRLSSGRLYEMRICSSGCRRAL